jgi:hypothetical protein
MAIRKHVFFKTELSSQQLRRLKNHIKNQATIDVMVDNKGDVQYKITLLKGEMNCEVAIQFGIIIGVLKLPH